jgi:hypothetical protein
MDEREHQAFRAKLNETGEAQVRINLANEVYGAQHAPLRPVVEEWLRQQEEKRREAAQSEQTQIARSAADAAWESARTAQAANKRATIALVLAGAAVVVSHSSPVYQTLASNDGP